MQEENRIKQLRKLLETNSNLDNKEKTAKLIEKITSNLKNLKMSLT